MSSVLFWTLQTGRRMELNIELKMDKTLFIPAQVCTFDHEIEASPT